ncbi:MAG TPA: glucosamine-6-phosphate deaminase [Ignavibacteriaceae bacterium]|nr:glucosamine-6-phosphate deaminase [Ignavibacteriaceae bacterium]
MQTIGERILTVERLRVVIVPSRQKLGEYSAENVSKLIKNLLQKKDEVRMIFAAAPSQDEFLQELVKDKSIDWSKIIAFHMDEYIGLPENAEQLFSEYLTRHLFSKVNFKKVHIINSNVDDIDKECARYELLLKENPIDIVCMGIGENGHIAFNDPPVADFSDKKFVKIVKLDESCRNQQVNDGCFLRLSDVPTRAITLTIPALLNGKYLNVVVTGIRKANAIKDVLSGNISTECPASIIRKHKNAILYLDLDSASKYLISA